MRANPKSVADLVWSAAAALSRLAAHMLRQSATWLLAVSATGELQPEIGRFPAYNVDFIQRLM